MHKSAQAMILDFPVSRTARNTFLFISPSLWYSVIEAQWNTSVFPKFYEIDTVTTPVLWVRQNGISGS